MICPGFHHFPGRRVIIRNMHARSSGVLLHVTSLDSPFGIGDLGPGAMRFVDFLAAAGQRIWQVLPCNPTGPGLADSPYSSFSAFASWPMLLSPEILLAKGLLSPGDLENVPDFPEGRVDYPGAIAFKMPLLHKAADSFVDTSDYIRWCGFNAAWLDDHCLFAALKEENGGNSWSHWPDDVKWRNPESLKKAAGRLAQPVRREKVLQYLLDMQWTSLRSACHDKGIRLVGDLPIYVTYDSADVWSHRELFQLDEGLAPRFVSGAPPDYFSETGQLWNNPVYDWEAMRHDDFNWWTNRVKRMMTWFDSVRIDHFRGFVAYWSVPAGEQTAAGGTWVEAPAMDLFKTLGRRLFGLPFIAEDLGMITPDVREILGILGIPGTKVLLFSFDEDNPAHPYLPHNFVRNCVVYTGTHDNNTVRGWYENEASARAKERVAEYLGHDAYSAADIHRAFVRLAMFSVADTVIIPMQDVLGLGAKGRMNTPGTTQNNWTWRVLPAQLDRDRAGWFGRLTEISARL